MKRVWTIQTMNGNYYRIDGRGTILSYSGNGIKNVDPNGWRITGCAKRAAFNRIISQGLQALLNLASWKANCTFKNGTAQFYLTDYDHGSNRVQMEGIRHVFATDEMEKQ